MKLAFHGALCYLIGVGVSYHFWYDQPCQCPETLPTSVTDMFTIQGDTLVIKQGVEFVISTHAVNIDTAGIIYRKNK